MSEWKIKENDTYELSADKVQFICECIKIASEESFYGACTDNPKRLAMELCNMFGASDEFINDIEREIGG